MSNIKFTYKFALVFLVLALATVIAGGFGLLQLSKINAFSEDFSSKWLPGITDVNAILADVNTMRRAEIQHTLTELNEEKLPEEDTINAAKLKISEAANKYKTIIQADNDDGKFDEFQKVLTRYYAADKTLLDLSNKLPPDPISTGAFLNGESQSALRALLKALDAMVVHSNSQADVATVSAKSSYEAARLGLITVVVVTCLAAIVLGIWITRLITKPLAFAVNAAQGYSKGDLSLALEVHGTDELSLLLHAMEDMRKSLARVVSSTRNNSVLVANASAEIAHGNQDLSARTESQASALEETAASMEELSSQVKHNAENAHQANQLASNASITAVRGGEVVGRVVDTMKEINVSSGKISEIISFCQLTRAARSGLPSSSSPWRRRSSAEPGSGPGFRCCTRTRYSFSTRVSSPISSLATRPSCVSTSRPVESMSSRPAGARLRRWPGWKVRPLVSPGQRLAGLTSVMAGS